MQNIKAITHMPGWAQLLQEGDKVNQGYNAYAAVPLVFRAIRLRADSLASVPVKFYRGDAEIEWGFDANFTDLIWKTEAAMLLTGGAYWLKATNRVRVTDIMFLNPYSVQVVYDAGTGAISFHQVTSVTNNRFTEDEIVYFREYDPIQDIEPGVAAASVALGDAQMMHYMTRFAGKFFEGGAMPVTVLGMQQVSDAELKRVEGVFRRVMSGVRNAFKILGVRADSIDIKPLTPPLKDLTMPELYDQSKMNIANAFGIPITMLEEPSANRATAGVHHFSFWAETMRPRGRLFEEVINEQLLEAGGITMQFDFDSMDVFQVDEAQRSASLLNLVNAKIPLDVAIQVLGFDLTDEQMARVDEVAQASAQARDNFIANTSDQQPTAEADRESNARAIRADLVKWRKVARKRLDNGQNPAYRFYSDVIPPGISKRVYTTLRLAKTNDDIDVIFERALGIDWEEEEPDIGELVDALREAVKAVTNEQNG